MYQNRSKLRFVTIRNLCRFLLITQQTSAVVEVSPSGTRIAKLLSENIETIFKEKEIWQKML